MANKSNDKPKNGNPSAGEVGFGRSYLARNKVPPHVANEIVKMTKTRAQIGDELAVWCNNQQGGG